MPWPKSQAIELSVKYLKPGVLDPTFAKTSNDIKIQDEKITQGKKGIKLVFSSTLVLTQVLPPVLDLHYALRTLHVSLMF